MALKSTLKPTRVDIPDEPGEWIEYKPISTDELDSIDTNLSNIAYTKAMLLAVLTSWSYGELNAEALGDLEAKTFRWLDTNVTQWAGLRSDAEKKESISPSPDTSEPEPADSLQSSLT